MYESLSLQQSPPFSVPARFFVTAPLFGIAAALILLLAGPDALSSRWTPAVLSITHALVLGFLATVMIGALQQVLPVVAGVSIRQPRRIATLVHSLWVPGVAVLTVAFLKPLPGLFHAALVLITAAVAVFAGAVIHSLAGSFPAGNRTVPGIRLAVFSLVVTLIFGILLVLGHTGVIPLHRPGLTDLHLTWGFMGWITVLVMTVGWQVVPMFQITPSYPAWLRQTSVPLILGLLVVKSMITWAGDGGTVGLIEKAADFLLAATVVVFAMITLRLQQQAKRKRRDSHRYFWRLAMLHLIFAALLWAAGGIMDNALLHLLAGTIFILGFAMAVVTGMLLKIVAFLSWLHLQQQRQNLLDEGRKVADVPKMNAVVSQRTGNRLLLLLIAAQTAVIAGLLSPAYFGPAAALLWLILYTGLAVVLVNAFYRYYRFESALAVQTGQIV